MSLEISVSFENVVDICLVQIFFCVEVIFKVVCNTMKKN